MLFIIEEKKKKNILDFWQGSVKVLWLSSYNLARVAKVSDPKVIDCTSCKTVHHHKIYWLNWKYIISLKI